MITWNRSFKGGVLNPDTGRDDFDSEENETHATVLDKMLAWEKKLYDEVKVAFILQQSPSKVFLIIGFCFTFINHNRQVS